MVFSKVGRRLRDEQRGAVLVLTSLAVVAVLGITALVIDIGHANTTGRSNQTTADASAIAAGWDIADAATARTTAAEYVADNFDVSMPTSSTCPTGDSITADTVCYEVGSRKIWITTPWDGSDYLLRVEICEDVDTSFAGVIGFDTVNVCRYAISEAEPPTDGDGDAGPAIQAFGPADKKSFETTGNGTIWTNGDIMIASIASEAFVANGSGGVTATGEVWYDSSGGGCASLPHCGNPGFLDETSTPPVPEGNLPQGCDPDPATTGTYCGDPNFFLDVYRDSFIRNTDLSALALCLINGLESVGCEAYHWPGAPSHSINNSLSTDGPLRTGDTTTPTCDNGVVWMNPGYYSTTAQ
ncbi:MAG: Tad domain-containing protein, partial [Acidimicrobiia bacterium]|nr:Tad domain-containing protein [Acidimicrobiia bacterium]